MALPCLRVFGKSWFSEEQRKDRAKGGREDKEGHGLPHSRSTIPMAPLPAVQVPKPAGWNARRRIVAARNAARDEASTNRASEASHADEGRVRRRREIVLSSFAAPAFAALFSFGAAPRPKGLGVLDYGSGVKTLGLCPNTDNCISTAEIVNDPSHYVPAWSYMPQDGRGLREKVTQEQVSAVFASHPASLPASS